MNERKPIFVTQPYLPPLQEFIPLLEEIWTRRVLTNGGPFHQQLEDALCKYLGVKHLSLFTNGTIALVTALQALQIKGEVITTPYSFVATAHSLLWNGIKPVFVDIDPLTLNLDPDKIEAAITSQTTAILPVHVYGTPCDAPAIQRVAERHGLKVIYDAAHAFGVKNAGGSILRYGDLSVLSFHATKVFNTFEGGAIICHDAEMKRRIDDLKNFGFVDETTVVAPGINGKMNEFSAALGLVQLQHVDAAICSRRDIAKRYRTELGDIDTLEWPTPPIDCQPNYAYMPVLVNGQGALSRDSLFNWLRQNDILARRYFFPLISEFPMYRDLASASPSNLAIAQSIANRVICLPIFPDMNEGQLQRIIEAIRLWGRSGQGMPT